MKKNLILGIETSGILCSVAWYQKGNVLLDYNLESPNVHATLLADWVKKGCAELELNVEQIDLIAVATGPGSFTGLRIGMSYAKGFCFGLDKPLIGVSNFAILAHQAPMDESTVCTLIDAGRDNYYWGIFNADRLIPQEMQIINKKLLSSKIKEKSFVILHDKIELSTLKKSIGPEIRLGVGKYNAAIICEIAEIIFESVGTDRIDAVEPLYLQAFAGVR